MLKNKKLLEGNINFILFVAIVLVIMIFSQKINYKLDITPNKTFTLSKLSKQLVKGLDDPLIVKVFLSKDLPNNYKNVPTRVTDVLSEYSRVSKNFTYTIYNCTIKDAERSKKIQENIAEAERYEVSPMSLRDIERNEIKLVNGYLTMVIEYGSVIEKLNIIESYNQLEYALTKILYKIDNKLNKFYSLPEEIKVSLYLSENIGAQSKEIKEAIAEQFQKSKDANLGQLAYEVKTSFDSNDQKLSQVNANAYEVQGSDVSYAVIVIQKGEQFDKIELLEQKPSLDLSKGKITYQYGLVNIQALDKIINQKVESLLEINDDISYLDDKGTMSMITPPSMYGFPGQNTQQAEGDLFYKALEDIYDVNLIKINEIAKQDSTLIIAGAKESFSDWDLLQIDQFVMKGGNLIVFRDPYKDLTFDNNPQFQGRSVPVPNEDGLDKLINHYGVKMETSYIMDAMSVNNVEGDRHIQYYQVPTIVENNINKKEFPFLRSIKSFWAFEMGNIGLDQSALSNHQVKVSSVFSSSKNAWVNEDANRQANVTPPSPNDYNQYSLAYLLKGEFKSYFHDKDTSKIDSKSKEDKDGDKAEVDEGKKELTINVEESKILKKSLKPGKILVVGSSRILYNNFFNGSNPPLLSSRVFWQNMIDYMSGNPSWGEMRGKSLAFNPIQLATEDDWFFKRLFANSYSIKLFNLIGLPIFIILVGVYFYFKRKRKKTLIQKEYSNK